MNDATGNTTDVLIVDWLGRGGIAQMSEAWAMVLGAAGSSVTVVTRPGRELGAGSVPVDPPRSRPGTDDRGLKGRLLAHRRVARHAADRIRELHPKLVVVQNYVVPYLERPVYEAARIAGARIAVVVHDHQLHSRTAGYRRGLSRLLERADVVVAHTPYVADRVATMIGSGGPVVDVVPLPVPLGVLQSLGALGPRPAAPDRHDPRLLAAHIGMLQRAYKGTDTVLETAQLGVPGWRFAVMGPGAPTLDPARPVDGLSVLAGFRPIAEVAALVERAQAVVLPYRFATQSGVVVLAQALRTVPVVTAVGGLVDQVDATCGVVVPVGASASVWRDRLIELSDPEARLELADSGHDRIWNDHRRFEAAVGALAVGGMVA